MEDEPDSVVEELEKSFEAIRVQEIENPEVCLHRIEQKAPRFHRKRYCPARIGFREDQGHVIIHLWSEMSAKWTLEEHVLAKEKHSDLIFYSSFEVSLQRLKAEWRTVRVSMPFERASRGVGEKTNQESAQPWVRVS